MTQHQLLAKQSSSCPSVPSASQELFLKEWPEIPADCKQDHNLLG